MFLGVSGTVQSMEMTDYHRRTLGGILRHMRLSRFGGNRKAAYTAAGVNAATWGRLEEGLSVKEQTLAKVLLAFFPESEGDWAKMDWRTRDGHLTLAVPGHAITGPPRETEDADVLADVLRHILGVVEPARREEAVRKAVAAMLPFIDEGSDMPGDLTEAQEQAVVAATNELRDAVASPEPPLPEQPQTETG